MGTRRTEPAIRLAIQNTTQPGGRGSELLRHAARRQQIMRGHHPDQEHSGAHRGSAPAPAPVDGREAAPVTQEHQQAGDQAQRIEELESSRHRARQRARRQNREQGHQVHRRGVVCGGRSSGLHRRAIQPGASPAQQDQAACHRNEGHPAGLRMKSVYGDIGEAGISDQDQRRDSQYIEPENCRDAGRYQQEGSRKYVFAAGSRAARRWRRRESSPLPRGPNTLRRSARQSVGC